MNYFNSFPLLFHYVANDMKMEESSSLNMQKGKRKKREETTVVITLEIERFFFLHFC